MGVQALFRRLNPFRCTQLGSPTQVYRALRGNLLSLLTSPLLLSHALVSGPVSALQRMRLLHVAV